MNTRHDGGYKRLFSHPEFVRDLITGFIPDPWLQPEGTGGRRRMAAESSRGLVLCLPADRVPKHGGPLHGGTDHDLSRLAVPGSDPSEERAEKAPLPAARVADRVVQRAPVLDRAYGRGRSDTLASGLSE
ncbi:hypothetical protein CCP4SC76_5380001 [Gammaproteobacteria bacterium]